MRRNQRATRLFTGALALPLAAALIAGCSSTNDPAASKDAEPVAGGTLVYASGDAEPSCLDPHVGGNYPQALVASQFMESLFTKDAEGKIIPWLAEKTEVSTDGLTRTITVRDGITFHDGTKLTSEAIKANIEHLQNPNTASSTGYLAVGKVDRIKLVDELTAELKLSAPDNALLESLSMPWTAIQSPQGLKRDQAANCAALQAPALSRLNPGTASKLSIWCVTKIMSPRQQMPSEPAQPPIWTASPGASSLRPPAVMQHCSPARLTSLTTRSQKPSPPPPITGWATWTRLARAHQIVSS
jgi:ABC-type dipeptide transport system, periplasmic component